MSIPSILRSAKSHRDQLLRWGTEAIETFVEDIVRRSKDCERLIAALPRQDESSTRVSSLCLKVVDTS